MTSETGAVARAAPLTIAVISNLYPPYIIGGYEMMAHAAVEGLRARGHSVHVITGRGRDLPSDGFTHSALDLDLDRKADYFLGGLPLTAGRVVRWHLLNPATRRAVQATLAQLQPDLIVSWSLYMASVAPLVAAHRYGAAPIVVQLADKWLLYSLYDIGTLVPATTWMQRAYISGLRRFVQPLLRRWAQPDYILAVSEFIRTLHTRVGFAEAQSLATWWGINSARFPFMLHAFPEDRPWRLLFASQLWEGKGPQVAVEAVALLRARDDIPPVTLDIYGTGTDNFVEYLRSLIESHGLADSVHMHGFAPQTELAAAFAGHDLYLFCSTWDEPFSGGLLEAVCSGIPTIATTTGGSPEAVRHEENGLLVPPGDAGALADAVVRFMHDPELYGRVGACAGSEVAARWSFDAYLDRIEGAYEAIVAGHCPGTPVDISGPAQQAGKEPA